MTQPDPNPELNTMRHIARLMAKLDRAGQDRVARWTADLWRIKEGEGA